MTEDGDPPVDDTSVDDGTILFRWVPPAHIRRTDDGAEWRDGVFKNFPNPEKLRVSIVLGDKLSELKRGPETIIENKSGHGVIGIRARDVRAEQQRVERSPRDDEPAHGDVWGEKPAARRRRLALHAFWVVEPPAG